MNKISLYFILYLISQILFSCHERVKTCINIEVLDQERKRVNLSALADSIEYIPLSSDSILDIILKIEFSNSYIYVKDKKSLFAKFSGNGDFITEIGKRGNGPQEYNYVNDFVVDNETEKCYVLNYRHQKIYAFESNGDFIETMDLAFEYPTRFCQIAEGLFIYYNNSRGKKDICFEIIDIEGNVIEQFKNDNKFNIEGSFLTFKDDCILYKDGEKVCYKEIHSDTVFYVENQEVKIKYVLNSEDKSFVNSLRSNPIFFMNHSHEFIMQTNLFETKNYIFYEYWYQSENRILTYCKGKNYSFEIDAKIGFINDMDGGPNLYPKFVKSGNTLIGWVDAYKLKAHVVSDIFKNSTPLYPEKKKQLEQLANSLNENDNPVLMLVKLKDD